MWKCLFFPACLVFLAIEARADDTIVPNTVQAVKRATVFIRVERSGREASGSGFVIARDGEKAVIVTNHHVLSGVPTSPNGDLPPVPANVKVTVVFDSGARQERSAKAEVLASDPQNDLAVLRVSGVRDLPVPISYAEPPKLTETMAVWTFGFPFGQALSTTKGNPSVTVGKASISSLRTNEEGELVLVQIDGSLNPGNSGGPVVDVKGRLAGVAVATIKSSGIGFIIPSDELGQLLEGRIGGRRLVFQPAPEGKTKARVELAMLDPFNKVKSVSLHYVVAAREAIDPKAREALERQPGCKTLKLAVDKNVAIGELPLDVNTGKLLVQAVWQTEGGKSGRGIIGSHMLSRAPAPERPDTGAGRTKLIGGGFGRDPFQDAAPDKALLVGVEVGLGKFGTIDVIQAVRAVFRAGDKETLGQQWGTNLTRVTRLVAKPGYAVGAMTVKAGANADGLSVTFMRIKGDRLDAKDAYESDWVGDTRPGGKPVLSGEGRPIVGIFGTKNKENTTGIGLLFDRSGKDDPVAIGTPTGKEYAPKNGQYTIQMPTGVRSMQRTQILNLKTFRVPLESNVVTMKDGTLYIASSIGIPAVVMREIPAEDRFDSMRDLITKQIRGKVVEEKNVKRGDWSGKEYQIEGGQGAARMLLFMNGGFVLYAVVDGKTRDAVTSKEADAFIASFKMLEKKGN